MTDPDLDRAAAEALLREAVSWPRSHASWVVLAAAVVGVGLGLAIAVLPLGLREWPSFVALGTVGGICLASVGWVVVGRGAARRASARREAARRTARTALCEVPAEFAAWAETAEPRVGQAAVVRLGRGLAAARTASGELDSWRRGRPDLDGPHANAVVDPVFLSEYEAARAELDELAEPLGYEVPAEVAPESLR